MCVCTCLFWWKQSLLGDRDFPLQQSSRKGPKLVTFCDFYHANYIFSCLEKWDKLFSCVSFNTTFSITLNLNHISLCYWKGFLIIRHKNIDHYYSELKMIETYRLKCIWDFFSLTKLTFYICFVNWTFMFHVFINFMKFQTKGDKRSSFCLYGIEFLPDK